jgi:hypothetical protein
LKAVEILVDDRRAVEGARVVDEDVDLTRRRGEETDRLEVGDVGGGEARLPAGRNRGSKAAIASSYGGFAATSPVTTLR